MSSLRVLLPMAWRVLALSACLLAFSTHPAFARNAYVTDSIKLNLFKNPNFDSSILAELSSGVQVEVIEEVKSWSYVRTADGKQGYVVTRNLTDRVPLKVQYDQLKAENEQLKADPARKHEQLITMTNENRELKAALETAQAELGHTRQQLTQLRSASANVATLQDQYEKTNTALKEASTTIDKLTGENRALRGDTAFTFFMYGAGVVFVSAVLGFIFGRIRRKQRSSLSY